MDQKSTLGGPKPLSRTVSPNNAGCGYWMNISSIEAYLVTHTLQNWGKINGRLKYIKIPCAKIPIYGLDFDQQFIPLDQILQKSDVRSSFCNVNSLKLRF